MSPDTSTPADAGPDAHALGGSAAAAVPELAVLAQLLIERRQSQGLSLPALAQRLHMGLEQLQALELADPQQLPEPVFVIAQARRVADALGLDISAQIEALRANPSFMAGRPVLKAEVFQDAATRQRQSPSLQPLPQLPAEPRSLGAVVRPLAWILLLAGLGSGGTWVWQNRQLGQPLWSRTVTQVAQLVPVASRPAPSRPSALPPAVVPKPKPQPAVALRLSARQPSWLDVRPLRGGPSLFRGSFVGERRFPLGSGLMVRAGRPDLVLASLGSAPAKPLGTISQVRWVRFTSAAQPPKPDQLAKPKP